MKAFWAHMYVGHTIEFAGDSWEDGGFRVDPNGNPASDANGNTVANYSARDMTGDDAELDESIARLAYQAFAGDDRADRDEFAVWLKGQGFVGNDLYQVLDMNADALTQRCAYCDREVKYRDPEKADSGSVPAKDDDDAWDGLAEEHESDCEWIATRAHRVGVA